MPLSRRDRVGLPVRVAYIDTQHICTGFPVVTPSGIGGKWRQEEQGQECLLANHEVKSGRAEKARGHD